MPQPALWTVVLSFLALGGLVTCKPPAPAVSSVPAAASQLPPPKEIHHVQGDWGIVVLEAEAHHPARVVPAPGKPLSAVQTQALLGLEYPPAPGTPPVQLPMEAAWGLDSGTGAQSAAGSTPGSNRLTQRTPFGAPPYVPVIAAVFEKPLASLPAIHKGQSAPPWLALTPSVPGRWHYLGTRVALFEPEERLPSATHFEIGPSGQAPTTPAGAAPLAWSFDTRGPQVQHIHPLKGATQISNTPLLYLRFSQPVQPASVLQRAQLSDGQRNYPLRLLSPTEVAQLPKPTPAQRLTKRKFRPPVIAASSKDLWVVLKASTPLPNNAELRFVLTPGAVPSKGNVAVANTFESSFKTHGALKVSSHSCDKRPCKAKLGFSVTFNHQLDSSAEGAGLLTVEPKVQNLSVQHDTWSGRQSVLRVRGEFKANTRYVATLSTELKDVFGQSLASAVRLPIEMGDSSPARPVARGVTPRLEAPGGRVLSSLGAPRQTLRGAGLREVRVQIRSVEAKDWPRFKELQQGFAPGRGETPTLAYRQLRLGKHLETFRVKLAGAPDAQPSASLDLSRYLPNGVGNLALFAEGIPAATVRKKGTPRPRLAKWVTATKMSLHSALDSGRLHVWVSEKLSGKPLSGVQLELTRPEAASPQGVATTDAAGYAHAEVDTGGFWLQAQLGADSLQLWHPGYGERRQEGTSWAIMDNGGAYHPEDTVQLSGWIHRVPADPTAERTPLVTRGRGSLRYEVGYLKEPSLSGTGELSPDGHFDIRFKLPKRLPASGIWVALQVNPKHVVGSHIEPKRLTKRHRITIARYAAPEQVLELTQPTGQALVGQELSITARRRLFGGGAVTGKEVFWRISQRNTPWFPAGLGAFHFGSLTTEAWVGPPGDDLGRRHQPLRRFGLTDARGEHNIALNFAATEDPFPKQLRIRAELAQRSASGPERSLWLHPASLAAGLRASSRFGSVGKALGIDVLATDTQGKIVTGAELTLSAERQTDSKKQDQVERLNICALRSTLQPGSCPWVPSRAGKWVLSASVVDSRGRESRSALDVFVFDPQSAAPPVAAAQREQARIYPDRSFYRAGDKVRLLLASPLHSGHGLLLVEGDGLQETRKVRFDAPNPVVELTAKRSWGPEVAVRALLTGQQPPPQQPRVEPALTGPEAQGQEARYELYSKVLLEADKSRLKLNTRLALTPGDDSALTVRVQDATDGNVAGARVQVLLVPDDLWQLESMGSIRAPRIHGNTPVAAAAHSSGSVQLSTSFPEQWTAARPRPAAGRTGTGTASGTNAWTLPRLNYASATPELASGLRQVPSEIPLKLSDLGWLQSGITNAAGQVRLPLRFKRPGTRHHLVVVAATQEGGWGRSQQHLTTPGDSEAEPAKANLAPGLTVEGPAFARSRDRFAVTAVVHNPGRQTLRVRVACTASNAELETAGRGKSIDVPGGARVGVRFMARPTAPGSSLFSFYLNSQNGNSSQSLAVPISKASAANPAALEAGFSILREYVTLHEKYDPPVPLNPPERRTRPPKEGDTRADKPLAAVRLKDGAWRIPTGAHVLVRALVYVSDEQTDVELIDPVVPGFQLIGGSSRLQLISEFSIGVSSDQQATGQPLPRGFTFPKRPRNKTPALRSQLAAQTKKLRPGVYLRSYQAVAQTPGHFQVPPLRIRAAGSAFGRSSGARVVIQ